MKRLIADFNRDWPDVTRTREVLVLAEELGEVVSSSSRRRPGPIATGRYC